MWGFSKNDNIEQRAEVQATRKMIGFTLGLVLFLLSALRFIPKDLFTTAAWLDRKGLGLLYSSEATAFAPGSFWEIRNITVPVSEEAFWFAVMITVLQLVFGYLIGTAGSYIKDSRDGDVESVVQYFAVLAKSKGKAKTNWKKMNYFFTFVALAMFDTYTDWQFSSRFGQTDILIISLLYSLLIYNIASEFGLMYGLQLAIGNAPDAIVGFFQTSLAIITAPFKANKARNKAPVGGGGHKPGGNPSGGGGGKPGGGNQQQQQQQQKQRHPGGGGGGNQQNHQQRHPNNGGGNNGGGHPAPSMRPVGRPEMPVMQMVEDDDE